MTSYTVHYFVATSQKAQAVGGRSEFGQGDATCQTPGWQDILRKKA